MWGTSSSEEKLAGDPGNVIEATSIGGRRSDFFTAGKLTPGNFGLLQQYLPERDVDGLFAHTPAHQAIGQPLFVLGTIGHPNSSCSMPLVKANRRLIGLKYPKPKTVRRGTLHLGEERCADAAALVARMNVQVR